MDSAGNSGFILDSERFIVSMDCVFADLPINKENTAKKVQQEIEDRFKFAIITI